MSFKLSWKVFTIKGFNKQWKDSKKVKNDNKKQICINPKIKGKSFLPTLKPLATPKLLPRPVFQIAIIKRTSPY